MSSNYSNVVAIRNKQNTLKIVSKIVLSIFAIITIICLFFGWRFYIVSATCAILGAIYARYCYKCLQKDRNYYYYLYVDERLDDEGRRYLKGEDIPSSRVLREYSPLIAKRAYEIIEKASQNQLNSSDYFFSSYDYPPSLIKTLLSRAELHKNSPEAEFIAFCKQLLKKRLENSLPKEYDITIPLEKKAFEMLVAIKAERNRAYVKSNPYLRSLFSNTTSQTSGQ